MFTKIQMLFVLLSFSLCSWAQASDADKKEPSIFELNCNQSNACEMAKVDEIANIISERVKLYWSAVQSQRDLRAKVHLELSSTGEIVLLEIDLSSGDDAFDESLKTAIYQSFPIEEVKFIKPEVFDEQLKENRIMFMGGF